MLKRLCVYALRPNVQDRLRDQRGVLAVSLTLSPGDSSSYKLWKYEPEYRSVAPLSSHVLRPHRMYVTPPVQCKVQQSVAFSLIIIIIIIIISNGEVIIMITIIIIIESLLDGNSNRRTGCIRSQNVMNSIYV